MHWLVERLSTFEERKAVTHGGTVHTYGDLATRVAAFSEALARASVRPHEVVGIVGDYSFDAIAAFLALLQNRNVLVPIVGTVGAEAAEMLDEASVDKVVRFGDRELSVAPREAGDKHVLFRELRERDSAGMILFSSGSTGKPKAMIHDLGALIEVYKDRKARKLTILLFLMFDHIGGLNTLLSALSMGATVVIPESRDPELVCRLIEEHRVGLLPCSPTFLNLMLISGAPDKHDMSSLRMISYGTEPMPESLLGRLRQRFPRVRLLQTFGTSETGIARTASLSSDSLYFKIDDPNIRYKVVDGELWLHSDTRIAGYLNAGMESFTEDGWFRTGDLVELGEDGYLKIVGRNSDVINVGGQKVLPAEVESALLALASVDDCTVYGCPSAITGQTVVAEVVLAAETEPKAAKREIRRYCAEHLEPFKAPSKIIILHQASVGSRFKKIRRPGGTPQR